MDAYINKTLTTEHLWALRVQEDHGVAAGRRVGCQSQADRAALEGRRSEGAQTRDLNGLRGSRPLDGYRLQPEKSACYQHC